MKRKRGREYDEASIEQLQATDAMLDVFGAVTWGDDEEPLKPDPSPVPVPRQSLDDPVLAMLLALRADVDAEPEATPLEISDARVNLAPVVSLRSRRLQRVGVGVAVAAAVLSATGVAAASVADVRPLHALHQAIWGPTGSQKALAKSEHFAVLASKHLDAGELTASGEALDQAEFWLARVDLEEQGSTPQRIASLRDALTAAWAAQAAAQQAADDARRAQEAASHPTPTVRPPHGKRGSGEQGDGERGKGSGDRHGQDDGRGSGDSSGHNRGGDGSDGQDSRHSGSGGDGSGGDGGEHSGAEAGGVSGSGDGNESPDHND